MFNVPLSPDNCCLSQTTIMAALRKEHGDILHLALSRGFSVDCLTTEHDEDEGDAEVITIVDIDEPQAHVTQEKRPDRHPYI